MLLQDLALAVQDFSERTNEPLWKIAARAGMPGSQLSATLKAGRPVEEGGSTRSVEIKTAERLADAVELAVVLVPKDLLPEIAKLVARAKKRAGGG